MSFLERVLPGHPDKLADQIADALVDECLKTDSNARCAFEVMVSNGKVFIGGESSVVNFPEFKKVVMFTLAFNDSLKNVDDLVIIINVNKQSPYINDNRGSGAGDQAVVWGMASADNTLYLPDNLDKSQQLLDAICCLRSKVPDMGSDGKFLIDSKGERVTISISGEFSQTCISAYLQKTVQDIFGPHYYVYLNPPHYSKWIGGPEHDTGVTGRKIISDTYGPEFPHGGGALSGKDLTKVDRTGAYLARELSVELLNKYNKYLNYVSIELVYEMGGQHPFNFEFDYKFKNNRRDSGMFSEIKIEKRIKDDLDAFFEKESFSGTVERYMLDYFKDKAWNFEKLASPLGGHMYCNFAPWNSYKNLLE